jgi:hypothetical protein
MLQHKFVEFIPDRIEDGILYISIQYCTTIHKCVCGCGNEVVTPLSPTDWKLTFNGKAVSLHPSIGNWNFNCRSHYWIKNNEIEYAANWTEREIRAGRNKDLQRKKEHFEVLENLQEEVGTQENQNLSIRQRISNFFRL